MKLDRLLGIVTYLLRRGHATSGELAERFEVSRRTILRDVDAICRAGIPLATAQGSGGGICIQPGYRIEESVLTEAELRAVLAGVQAMDSVMGQAHGRDVSEKLDAPPQEDWIRIDLSAGAALFELLRDAILARRALWIDYCSAHGSGERVVEPHQLVYKWGGWYLIAWCRLRGEFRLFRLGRIGAARDAGEEFIRREIPAGMLLPDPGEPPCELTALYAPQMRHRLLDAFAEAEEMPDGRLCATVRFASESQRLTWALGFGADIEVIEPEEVRRELERHAREILRRENRI